MSVKRKKMYEILSGNKGFTLIEMAIVLIIIGIIIGAVVKGKDIIKSAEQKRLYTKFVQSWQLAYNTYYDRTGWILGDDASDTNATRDGHCDPTATRAHLVAQLRAVGLDVPVQGSTGSECVRTYTDSNGQSYDLTISFDYRSAVGNYIRIYSTNGIPFELGMAWDRIIDGQRDGSAGDLLYTADHTTTPAAPTFAAWPDATAAIVANSAAILKVTF